MLNHAEIEDLITRGGGVILDAAKLTPDALRIIATRAASSVTMKNSHRMTPEIRRDVAMRGQGKVIFDLTGI